MKDVFEKHGMFSWSELLTNDVDGALKFYGELLGWEYETFDSEGTVYHEIKAGGEEVGGIMETPKEAGNMPPSWGVYVTVDDVDAVAAKVAGLGGKLIIPPRDIPKVGRFCVIMDPQGAYMSLITYKFES